MRNKELTDSEIIKAYEFCLNNKNCIGCIADKNSKSGEFDCKLKPQDIIDVFNRLQAENERLKKISDTQKARIIDLAYKECIKKAKVKITQIPQYRFTLLEVKWYLDNLLKELVGDSQ